MATSPPLSSLRPPAINTFPASGPLAISVAEWCARVAFIAPVGVNVPVTGSKSSALLKVEPSVLAAVVPPAISTWPSAGQLQPEISVAVCSARAVLIVDATAEKVPLTGSYNSADDSARPVTPSPPATRILPPGNTVAV